MKAAPATFINVFMNIILPISRLPLIATCLGIYVGISIYVYYIYVYIYAQNFCFSEKVKHKKGQKEKVGKRRFVLYQHICTMYLSSKIHRNIFVYQNMVMIIFRSCNQCVS